MMHFIRIYTLLFDLSHISTYFAATKWRDTSSGQHVEYDQRPDMFRLPFFFPFDFSLKFYLFLLLWFLLFYVHGYHLSICFSLIFFILVLYCCYPCLSNGCTALLLVGIMWQLSAQLLLQVW